MGIWLNPKYPLTSPCIAAKYLYIEIHVQRSSLDEGVEPQAYGGRKIPACLKQDDT